MDRIYKIEKEMAGFCDGGKRVEWEMMGGDWEVDDARGGGGVY